MYDDVFQEIIAKTHADGSFFQTPEGTYVQLVNGVLTNVDITPMMQVQRSTVNWVLTNVDITPMMQVQRSPVNGVLTNVDITPMMKVLRSKVNSQRSTVICQRVAHQR